MENRFFNKIHHVAVICSDYNKSKDFYMNKLGLQPIREVYRKERESYKLDLAVGSDCMLELFSFPEPPKRPSYPEAAGLRHLAFEVEDIERTIAYLKSVHIQTEPIRIDAYTNKKCTFFSDPDGLPIEIYET